MVDPAAPSQIRSLILMLGIGAMASALAGRLLDPLVGVLAADFGVEVARVALLASAFALPFALVQPVLGPVGDAVGKLRVIRAALLVLAVALLLCALAPDLASLAVMRVVAGGAAGGIFPLAIALLGDRVPIERRSVALSRLVVAGVSGAAGGAALAPLLEPLIGWRGVMALGAAVAVAGWLALRAAPAEPPGRRLDLGEALRRYRHLLGLAAARRLYASVFLEGVLIYGLFPFLVPALEGRGLGGATEAGLAIAAFALGGIAFAALAGVLVARLGQAWMVRGGGAMAGAALLGVALAPAAWLLIAACLILGLGFQMMHNVIQTRVTEVSPPSRGSAVSLHAFSFFLGQSLGPVAMAAAWATIGPQLAFAAAGAGLALLGLWLARRR
jgi:predicted MFS family arabinose efflux permease